jgi:RNA polymerase sigma-70 factor (ECF subfamily)
LWHAVKHSLLSEERGDIRGSRTTADAFDSLFQQNEPRIFGYLWRMTGDRQLASDLSQETFLRAWQHFEKLSVYENPLGWLFRVATNLALDARRGRQRHGWLTNPLDDDSETAGADPTGSVLDREVILHILQGLSPKARAALVLREVYGLSLGEVATTLGMTLAATKKMLSRSREQFRLAYLSEGE